MASLPKKRQSNENRKEKKGLKLKKYLKISVAFHCGSREEIILKYFDLNCIPFKMCVCVLIRNNSLRVVFITDWFQVTNKSDFLRNITKIMWICVRVCA